MKNDRPGASDFRRLMAQDAPWSRLTCASGYRPPSSVCSRAHNAREPWSHASWLPHVARGSGGGRLAGDDERQRDGETQPCGDALLPGVWLDQAWTCSPGEIWDHMSASRPRRGVAVFEMGELQLPLGVSIWSPMKSLTLSRWSAVSNAERASSSFWRSSRRLSRCSRYFGTKLA